MEMKMTSFSLFLKSIIRNDGKSGAFFLSPPVTSISIIDLQSLSDLD